MLPIARLSHLIASRTALFGLADRNRRICIAYGRSPQLSSWSDDEMTIEVTAACESEPHRFAFELAHELVHALDPIELGHATVLEEGAATYFQHRYMQINFSNLGNWAIPQPGPYKLAFDIVCPLVQRDEAVFRTIRSTGTLSLLSTADLRRACPHLSTEDSDVLLRKFEDVRHMIV